MKPFHRTTKLTDRRMIPLPPCDHDDCPKTRCAKTESAEADSVQRPCSAFVADYNRLKEIWGERKSWERDVNGESRADRAYNGLLWSAALCRDGRWGKTEQTMLESAALEYAIYVRHALGMPNVPDQRPAPISKP